MNESIREAVRKRMKDAGTTQAQVAERLGIVPQYLSRMLNEHVGDVPKSWTKLFDLLGLELIVRPKRRKKKEDE